MILRMAYREIFSLSTLLLVIPLVMHMSQSPQPGQPSPTETITSYASEIPATIGNAVGGVKQTLTSTLGGMSHKISATVGGGSGGTLYISGAHPVFLH